MSNLANLNKLLPRGIKATEVNGQIRYTVRTSINGKRESLGTFLDQAAAVKALYEFKIKGSYTVAAESIADEVTSIVAIKQVQLESSIKTEERKTPHASQIARLHDYLNEVGSQAIGGGNAPITIIEDDGTITKIGTDAVAAVFLELFGMMPEGVAKIDRKVRRKSLEADDEGNDDSRFDSFFG